MSMEARLESLKRKHKDLNDRILALEAERAPEKFIKSLKIQKLMVKDEMVRTESEINETRDS